MIMIKKFCSHSNCYKIINFNEKHCEKHLQYEKDNQKYYNKQRYETDKDIRSVYNRSSWQRVRKSVLARDTMCLYCLANGIYTQSTMVDHFIPVRDAKELAYNTDNLVGCCITCNNRKVTDEQLLRENKITIGEFKSRWKFKIESE